MSILRLDRCCACYKMGSNICKGGLKTSARPTMIFSPRIDDRRAFCRMKERL